LPRSWRRRPGAFIVKIIESNAQQCLGLSSVLPAEVLVLEGDATDEACWRKRASKRWTCSA
jgi:trk system potassium uptake protein TrkA